MFRSFLAGSGGVKHWSQRIVGMPCIVGCLLLSSISTAEDVEIFRCALADGSVSFQELPCVNTGDPSSEESAPAEPDARQDDDFFNFENPFDNPPPVQQSVENDDDSSPPSTTRVACEKRIRTAIDVIDARLAKRPPADEARDALAELLRLTQQLRECKTL